MNEETDPKTQSPAVDRHLLTFYTRTPIHVGSGATVEVVDLPVARERTTGFPIIPGSGLKGGLLQRAREFWAAQTTTPGELPVAAKVLFGSEDTEEIPVAGAQPLKKAAPYAGCAQIMEAKLLAFPVRSLAGCFAWLTCPTALHRFQRDTGIEFEVPVPIKDHVVAGSDLLVIGKDTNGAEYRRAVLEEYALMADMEVKPPEGKATPFAQVVAALKKTCNDKLWQDQLAGRLAVLHDENFQHYVTSCTEVAQRIKLCPSTRTVERGGLFTQENVPCEALFYSVITLWNSRRPAGSPKPPGELLAELLPNQPPLVMQFGGDETTGHGVCEVLRQTLPFSTQA